MKEFNIMPDNETIITLRQVEAMLSWTQQSGNIYNEHCFG